MNDAAPTTLRFGPPNVASAAAAPAPADASPPVSATVARAMTRGQKAADTRRRNKAAAEAERLRVDGPRKERGQSKSSIGKKKGTRTMKHPDDWNKMSRGEKASWTRKANERAAKREAAKKTKAAPSGRGKAPSSRGTGRGTGRGKGRGKGKGGEGKFVPKFSADGAKAKLDKIRRENPELAEAIEEEIEATARARKLQGKKGHSGIVEALAPTHETSGSIIREGTVLGTVLDGSIVMGSGLLSARLDDMIQMRPMGLTPSTIKGIIEALVLAWGAWKRNKKVVKYSGLMLAGTFGGKLISAAARRSSPAPSP